MRARASVERPVGHPAADLGPGRGEERRHLGHAHPPAHHAPPGRSRGGRRAGRVASPSSPVDRGRGPHAARRGQVRRHVRPHGVAPGLGPPALLGRGAVDGLLRRVVVVGSAYAATSTGDPGRQARTASGKPCGRVRQVVEGEGGDEPAGATRRPRAARCVGRDRAHQRRGAGRDWHGAWRGPGRAPRRGPRRRPAPATPPRCPRRRRAPSGRRRGPGWRRPAPRPAGRRPGPGPRSTPRRWPRRPGPRPLKSRTTPGGGLGRRSGGHSRAAPARARSTHQASSSLVAQRLLPPELDDGPEQAQVELAVPPARGVDAVAPRARRGTARWWPPSTRAAGPGSSPGTSRGRGRPGPRRGRRSRAGSCGRRGGCRGCPSSSRRAGTSTACPASAVDQHVGLGAHGVDHGADVGRRPLGEGAPAPLGDGGDLVGPPPLGLAGQHARAEERPADRRVRAARRCRSSPTGGPTASARWSTNAACCSAGHRVVALGHEVRRPRRA